MVIIFLNVKQVGIFFGATQGIKSDNNGIRIAEVLYFEGCFKQGIGN